MTRIALCLLLCAAGSAAADTVVAARNLRPGAILAHGDVVLVGGETSGSHTDTSDVIGMEAVVAIYAGRPVMQGDIGAPAMIERNQIIEIVYESSGMSIRTDGRALGRGAQGDRIRVMNLASKSSLFGTVHEDGTVRVTP